MILDKEIQFYDVIKIKNLQVAAYTIPTDSPETDGTVEWNSTTLGFG